MGGNAFNDAKSIDIKHLYEIWPQIYEDLLSLGCKDTTPTGSTFRKLIMGDIDVTCYHDYNKLLQIVVDKFGKENVRKIGSKTISILWKGYVQIDIIIGNPQFIAWTHYGPSNLLGVEHSSQFKGTIRHILMSAILYHKTLQHFYNNDDYRTCYQFDIEEGIFKTFQTKIGTRSNKLKKWKTLKRDLYRFTPQQVIDFLFDKRYCVDYRNVYSFEELYECMIRCYDKEKCNEIIEYFLRDIEINVKEKPLRIASSPEEAQKVFEKLKNMVNR